MKTIPHFDAQILRIQEITGTTTQAALAAFLGIRQTFVVDAWRKNSIPEEWLTLLQQKCNASPDWMRTGRGSKKITPRPNES